MDRNAERMRFVLGDACDIVSSWHDQNNLEEGYDISTRAGEGIGWDSALRDLVDVSRADVFVIFTNEGGGGHDGRHVETGAYLHRMVQEIWDLTNRLRFVTIGPREHIFHCHPDAEIFDSFEDFLCAEEKR
jgi:hypothetical protein